MSPSRNIPSHPTDQTSPTLLQKMRDDDAEAWQRFVQLYEPLVSHWCLRRGLNENDASDLTQTVLAKVSEKLKSFDRSREGSTFRGWLRVVTRNQIIDFCRKAEQQEFATGGSTAHQWLREMPEADPLDPDEDQREISGLYQRAVDLMKDNFEPKTWRAFWMSVVEERPTAEVCEELNLKPGSVRMARHRVLKLLREQMGELLE